MTVIDWARYRKCPHCHAELGKPCHSLSGALAKGRVMGTVFEGAVLSEVVADRPHGRRELRVGHGRG